MNKEEQFMMDFMELFNKMIWLNNIMMGDRFKGYKASEVHCIEYIGKNVDSNVTKLAESFYMTRGAISKLTNKLIKKGIIESYQKPENKQKIYFRLTERGQAIYKSHEEMHQVYQERDKIVFEQVTEEQFNSMLRFVENYSRHLDSEIKRMKLE